MVPGSGGSAGGCGALEDQTGEDEGRAGDPGRGEPFAEHGGPEGRGDERLGQDEGGDRAGGQHGQAPTEQHVGQTGRQQPQVPGQQSACGAGEPGQGLGHQDRHQQEAAQAKVAELTASRDTTITELDAEVTQLQAQRSSQAGSLDEAMVALYEKIREQQGGVGAAELRQRRCGGCRLELNNVEINDLRDADPDEVMRCDECRRILVRTAESGL